MDLPSTGGWRLFGVRLEANALVHSYCEYPRQRCKGGGEELRPSQVRFRPLRDRLDGTIRHNPHGKGNQYTEWSFCFTFVFNSMRDTRHCDPSRVSRQFWYRWTRCASRFAANDKGIREVCDPDCSLSRQTHVPIQRRLCFAHYPFMVLHVRQIKICGPCGGRLGGQ